MSQHRGLILYSKRADDHCGHSVFRLDDGTEVIGTCFCSSGKDEVYSWPDKQVVGWGTWVRPAPGRSTWNSLTDFSFPHDRCHVGRVRGPSLVYPAFKEIVVSDQEKSVDPIAEYFSGIHAVIDAMEECVRMGMGKVDAEVSARAIEIEDSTSSLDGGIKQRRSAETVETIYTIRYTPTS